MENNVSIDSLGLCPICEREMIKGLNVDKHHLIPKCKGGKDTKYLHRICHVKLHSCFTENELAKEYYEVQKIRSHPEIAKFIHWVSNKPIDFYDSSFDTVNRSKRRRRSKR